MNDSRGPKPAQDGGEKAIGTKHEADDAAVRPRRRHARWVHIAAVALVAAGMAWAIGRAASQIVENRGLEKAARYQRPAAGRPTPCRTEDNNNINSKMGYVANLDGKVIAYAVDAGGLVSDGQFRIDLPLERMAGILRVSPDSIAKPHSRNEIDPNAELFRAQAGTLSETGKELSRKMRTRQLQEGKTPDAAFGDLVITNFSFSLNRLKQPNDEEKIVLSAIIRAAAGIMSMPGDKIRAVGVNLGSLEPSLIALAPGMLPPVSAIAGPQSRLSCSNGTRGHDDCMRGKTGIATSRG